MDTRNVIDFYKYWKIDAIKADLDVKRNNFSVLCVNLHHDFNISTVIRNCNAFLAKQIFIYGNKRFDRRGCVGTNHYERIVHLPQADTDLSEFFKQFYIVGIDNIENAKPIETYEWTTDKHILICFGEEQLGISKNILNMCQDVLYVKQYGSVRSMNVGTVSGIVMYDYCRKIIK